MADAIPTREELIATRMGVPEIGEFLGADSLTYLSINALRRAEGKDQGRFCEGCFTGEYPVDPHPDRLRMNSNPDPKCYLH